MSDELAHRVLYPTKEEVLAIHDDIIEEDTDATAGIMNEGDIEYALQYIEEGHFGQKPETLHEKAVELLRLIAANHPFADGNKRTALNATWTFYAMNGLYFEYGEEIKAILKLLAIKEEMVDKEQVVEYFDEITYPEGHERVPSSLVRITHLHRWREDYYDRREEIIRGVITESDKMSFDQFAGLIENLSEYADLCGAFVELREETDEELPEEVEEYIEFMEQEEEETVAFLTDLKELISKSRDEGRIPEEDLEEFSEKHGLTDSEKKLEEKSQEWLDRRE